jgi:hypothetical protein
MKNSFYIIALVLLGVWVIAFMGFKVGGVIHILLVIAFLFIMLTGILGREDRRSH